MVFFLEVRVGVDVLVGRRRLGIFRVLFNTSMLVLIRDKSYVFYLRLVLLDGRGGSRRRGMRFIV